MLAAGRGARLSIDGLPTAKKGRGGRTESLRRRSQGAGTTPGPGAGLRRGSELPPEPAGRSAQLLAQPGTHGMSYRWVRHQAGSGGGGDTCLGGGDGLQELGAVGKGTMETYLSYPLTG